MPPEKKEKLRDSSEKKSGDKLEEIFKSISVIIKNMEDEKISLEDSVDLYEKGVFLAKQARNIIQSAEQKIEELKGNTLVSNVGSAVPEL